MSLALFSTLVVVGLLGSLCTLAILVSALFHQERISHLEDLQRHQHLEALLRTAEMRRLQAQIQPHFLFNTLNVLARLAYLDRGREAAQGIYALSSLFRAMVKTQDRMHPLQEELTLTGHYLQLQQLRFGSRLRVRVEVPEELQQFAVPPLILQPLVENACKYAVEPSAAGAEIVITAERLGGQLLLKVTDSATPGGKSESAAPEPGLGIGLENVRQRLTYTFGPRGGLSVEQPQAGGTVVTLAMPLNLESGVSA